MAIKTIDLEAYSQIEIEGTTVEIKCLTNGQLQKLSVEFDAAEKTLDAKLAIVAPFVRIAGIEPSEMVDFLISIENVKTQAAIVEAVFVNNRLTPAEAGNSGSLSDGSKSSGPARESATIPESAQTDVAENAGSTKSISLSPSAING